jgi:CheY-like chemotaxis protein/GGDEF domain-containing protein
MNMSNNKSAPAVLILDPDAGAGQLLGQVLHDAGAVVTMATAKNDVPALLETRRCDIVIADPAPLTDIRGFVLSLRRKIPTQSYIAILDPDGALDPIDIGANDVLRKPARREDAVQILQNARGLLALGRRLNDPTEDFPSTGGVIAKSAFAQLFASGLDRADRYGERSHVLFIRLENYDQIRVAHDDYTANVAGAALAHDIARIRRQSDILGQTGQHEYALMLQRPAYDTEPVEAALRFVDSLAHSKALAGVCQTPLTLRVLMIEIPTGLVIADHTVDVKG